MKPRRTPTSTTVYELPGGNEDNSLWVEQSFRREGENTVPVVISTWELDDDDRAVIAAGGTVDLVVIGTTVMPVDMVVGPSLEERKRGA